MTDLPDGIPRDNGEPVFAAPWESRAFGVASAYLAAKGEDWDRFRHHLMDAIADGGPEMPYYEAWVGALERLLAADGVLPGPR